MGPRQNDEERGHRDRPALDASYDVLEHAPCGIAVVDRAGRIVSVNARVERDFGYARDELVGKSIDLLVPEHLRTAHAIQRAGFAAHGPAHRSMGQGRRLLGRTKSGGEIPIEIGLSKISDDRMAAFIVDVSERERQEEAVRTSEARYRAIFEHSNDALLVLDADGRIRECNLNTSLRLGVDRKDILGETLEHFASDAAAGSCRALVQAARDHGVARASALPLCKAHGEVSLVDASASLLQLGSELAVLVVLHRTDIASSRSSDAMPV